MALIRRDVELVVAWAFRDQLVLDGTGSYRTWWSNVSSTGHMVEIGTLGASIVGSPNLGADAHPDAHMVTVCMREMPWVWAAQVLKHGYTGTRPDWKPNARHRIEPVYEVLKSGRRRLVVEYDRNRNAVKCPIRSVDGPEVVGVARQAWSDWHKGLVMIANQASARIVEFRRFEVLQPSASGRPWQAPRDQALDTGPAKDLSES